MNAELDVEKMKGFYEFGGLLVYEVSYFDELSFKVRVETRTFSKKFAENIAEGLKSNKQKVNVVSYFIGFDGAYDK